MHIHGNDTHVHVKLNDKIACRICGWKGLVSECLPSGMAYAEAMKEGTFFIGADLYLCPNKLFYLFKCRAPLVMFGEEGGLYTSENARAKDSQLQTTNTRD